MRETSRGRTARYRVRSTLSPGMSYIRQAQRGKAVKFGVFIYDGVEPIDLATYGVLSMARRVAPAIEICTIAPEGGLVRLSSGLKVLADFGVRDAPDCDVLIVTGGPYCLGVYRRNDPCRGRNAGRQESDYQARSRAAGGVAA
jgi:hypothetical protein